MPQTIAEEFKSIPMSSNLGESLERAHRFARDQTHRTVTLEHLLLALTEDPEAALILEAANIELARLRTDVSGYLGRLQEDMRAQPGAEPRPDPELLRVLQAAASAAQQSKRKQIDGAIVLAAVVGDGKSPAAGTLKSHGMTFEEAIRALQRANTQARLKTPTKTSAAAKTGDAPPPRAEPAPAPAEAPLAAEHATLSSRLAQGGSADDILAAARARIQQRSSLASRTAAAEPEAPELAPGPEPQDPVESILAPEPQPPSGAFEELLAASVGGPQAYPYSQDGPPDVPSQHAARPGWAPPPDMRTQPNGRQAQGPMGRGPRQPAPPPHGARQGTLGAPGGFAPARAPWPEPGEVTGPARLPGTNGFGGTHYPDAGPAHAPQQRAPGPRGQGDRGPLVESVPRRMRAGVASRAEVRIARDRIEGLVAALNGTAHRGVARALSVRLRAPNGGFWIEPASPETQWVGGAANLSQDEYASWRWTVTPQRRGKAKLLLTVSARTMGPDGVPVESAPPDRLIEVRVAPNRMRRLGRLAMWMVVLAVGVAVGRHSDKVVGAAASLLKKALEF